MKVTKCSQVTCFAESTHRFTWPGSPEQPSCYEHAMTAQRVAEAMSFRLEVLPGALSRRPYVAPTVSDVDLCDQEGGTVDPVRGHEPGMCCYRRGHEGRHSWEPWPE